MKAPNPKSADNLRERRLELLLTPSDLGARAAKEVGDAMNGLLADVFALYVKTKNFDWHMTGRHFRDYHLLLDEQSDQIFSMTDDVAERARKIGGTTLHSIGEIGQYQRLKDNNHEVVSPGNMLGELAADNQRLIEFMRQSHELCEQHNDVGTTSLIEVWIDQAEPRVWFLSEVVTGKD